MDYNPLDLLASAAELQQQHDDGPEPIIVTRHKKQGLAKVQTPLNGGEKNQDKSNNNNNISKTRVKPSIVIVKKIKAGNSSPELEKMFDEHNYGNAKRNNNKHEQNMEENNGDISRNNLALSHICEKFETDSSVVENGKRRPRDMDLGTQCVQSSVNTGDSDKRTATSCLVGVSQADESHTSTPYERKYSVNGHVDKVTCLNTDSDERLQAEQGKCKCLKCGVDTCICNRNSHVLNIGGSDYDTCSVKSVKDKQCGCNDKLNIGMSHAEHVQDTNSVIVQQSLEVCKSNVEKQKFDDTTGEFITEGGTKVIIKSVSASNLNISGSQKPVDNTNSSLLERESCVGSLISLNESKLTDSQSAKSTSVSESAKMPFVKVMPSKDLGNDTAIDKNPEMLVINISRGSASNSQQNKIPNIPRQKSSEQPILENTESRTDSCIERNEKTSSNSVGVLKSIVVSDKVKEENKKNGEIKFNSKPLIFKMVPQKLKTDVPQLNTINDDSKILTYKSIKVLELSDPLCADDSTSSVHLLSPDRRNPDSMGLVGSPVTQSDTDVPDNCEFENPDQKLLSNPGATVHKCMLKETVQTCSAQDLLDLEQSEGDSDTRELMKESRFESAVRLFSCDNNSANGMLTPSSGNDVPIFRFDSDHCYAGVPGKLESSISHSTSEFDTAMTTELEEAATPVGCTSELSQDSGYEDTTTQSPITETQPVTSTPSCEQSNVKNLVPVLVSVNSNGSLTLHDPNLSKFSGKVLVPESSLQFGSGIKLIPGTSLTSVAQPLILSPVGRSPTTMIIDGPKSLQSRPESILGLLTPTKSDKSLNLPMTVSRKDVSPPKVGKFKIGSFGSISNTGLENGVGTPIKSFLDDKPEKVKQLAHRSRSNSGKSSPACMESLDNLVQKVKGNLSQPPVTQSVMESGIPSPPLDHIQHDHDYCTKSLMPSMVTSLLEQRLLAKDNIKPNKPIFYNKGRRTDSESSREFQKSESRTGKRKRLSSSLSKMDSLDSFDVDSESDTQSIPESNKSKSRYDKFLEKSRTKDPKVKITGSSDFQDQFVYFMHTTKRSRRRESRDSPLPLGNDRVFIPPKPGDIIVPHLTDQDIENLKQRSKHNKHSSTSLGMNSLRNEFMAAKLANQQFSAVPTSESADDEKSIINTILSMENDESLSSPVNTEPPSYNESMELYGQGLGTDIINLFPEQMNLTQEQMDLLYSAVDEVQNSSPGLIEEKLVSPGAESQRFESLIPGFEPATGLVDMSTKISQSGAVESVPSPLPSAPNSSIGVELSTKISTSENMPLSAGDATSHVAPNTNDSGHIAVDVASSAELHANVTAPLTPPSTDVSKGMDPLVSAGTAAVAEADSDSTTVPQSPPKEQSPAVPESAVQQSQGSANEVDAVGTSGQPLPASAEKVESLIPEPAVGESKPQTTDPPVNTSVVHSIPEPANVDPVPVNSSPEPSIKATITGINSSPDVPAISEQNVVTDKSLFPSPLLTSVPSLTSTVPADITTTQASTALTSDLSQLDILKNEFKLDSYVHSKSDIFSDSPVSAVSQPSVVSLLSPQFSSSVEYQAPWIVTVSMFWNDLPAIMISNQPYVRLVDIHKQILPAKDTGILKKRCQLMAIPAENCTEMQRYFIVQYGKAVNSKSTLIISLENAKELVGYYVNPQPKTANPSDHKSIIDHRREQLRRIALARRAAIRAQKPDKKDSVSASREHKDSTGSESVPDVVKTGEVVSPVKQTGPTARQPVTEVGRSQPATRHKKINFLEMLRGDSTGNAEDDLLPDQVEKKPKSKVAHDNLESSRKRKLSMEKKIKVVRYSVEMDSSEETDSVVSEYSSCYDTDSTSETDSIPVQRPPAKQRKLMPPLAYQKASSTKVKTYPSKPYMKNIKVKVRPNTARPIATSTPVSVQVNRNGGFQNGLPAREKNFLKIHYKASSVSLLGVRRKTFPEGSAEFARDMVVVRDSSPPKATVETVVHDGPTQNFFLHKSVGVEMSEDDLKVSPTLPDEILESVDQSESVTDDVSQEVGITDEESRSECSSVKENGDCLNNSKDGLIDTGSSSLTENVAKSVNTQDTDDVRPVLSLMKRKENVHISQDEVPLRIIHRDASPMTEPRTRTQLGEVFVDRYHNKRSICVRCYTCRKMLSVDNFLRHLHDNTGMLVVTSTRTLDISEGDLTEKERKLWETFQRKKELFDNNQLPSPDIVREGLVYQLESETSHFGKTEKLNPEINEKPSGPRIIRTPVSPAKKSKIVRRSGPKIVKSNVHQETVKPLGPKSSGVPAAKVSPPESTDGVRSSSRKRKLKQLYPFEEYSFAKFPRLNKNVVDNSEGN